MYPTTLGMLKNLAPAAALQLLLCLANHGGKISLVLMALTLLQPLPYPGLLLRLFSRSGRLERLSLAELKQEVAAHPHEVSLGKGFVFTPEHAQKLREIMDEGLPAAQMGSHGSPALHELSRKNRLRLAMGIDDLKAHTLILGTTGAGKTRMFDLLASQAVLRGDAVIVVDPKGDEDLRLALRHACKNCGRENAFIEVDLGHPERSVCWDPLGSYESVAELGSRITSLMSSSGSAASFRAYACNAVTAAAACRRFLKKSVTLAGIRDALTSAGTLQEAIRQRLLEVKSECGDAEVALYFDRVFKGEKAPSVMTLRGLYDWLMRTGYMESDPDLEIVFAAAALDRSYYEKVSAGALPILNSLSSGRLRQLLSSRRGISSKTVLDQELVLYVSLRTLVDSATGGAFGRLLLADLAAAAGRIYSRHDPRTRKRQVSVFIDEASEVMGEALVQLLNKSRGASFAVTLATQTLSDLSARSGSRDAAMQILGNANNLIALRLNDAETAKTVVAGMPVCRIMDRSGGTGYRETDGEVNTGTVSLGYQQREVPLIPPEVLPRLPDFEYFARLADGRVLKGRIPLIKS